jgi:pimeloyl-ACP methyl ester carboxylesterase
MPSVAANGITIEYDTSGDPNRPPLLLIPGLGGQLIAWDLDFVAALVANGFFVVRFDNRDAGRSTWFDLAGMPDLGAALAGRAQPAYLLSDMANDAAGLLDALSIESAHVFGLSMGGMIAQTLAIEHPGRVRTLTSIMSTTGDRSVGQPHADVLAAMMVAPSETRQGVVESSLKSARLIGSPGFPLHEDRIAARALAAYDRAFHPSGTARQAVAILASPDRTPRLRGLTIPTLVIHGESDPLVDQSGGRATAANVPGAQLWMIPGMGHDLPPELFGDIAIRVAAHAGVSST